MSIASPKHPLDTIALESYALFVESVQPRIRHEPSSLLNTV